MQNFKVAFCSPYHYALTFHLVTVCRIHTYQELRDLSFTKNKLAQSFGIINAENMIITVPISFVLFSRFESPLCH